MAAPKIIAFYWDVPQGGFRWMDASAIADATPRRWLTDAVPVGLAMDVRRYNPLDEYPALFRTFADTPLTEDGISRFANQFGGLGAWEQIRLTSGPEVVMGMGESRQIWMNEIDAMRRAVQLWDAVRHRDAPWFEQHVRVESRSSEEIWVSYLEEGVLYHREVIGPDLAGFVKPHDVRRPTLLVVQKMINTRLWEQTAPRLLYDPERDGLGVYLVPKNLLGALWLQFARAIDGNKDYRRCGGRCGQWMAISLDAHRTHKRFCSDACRNKAYRERQAEARRLYVEGLSVEQIAQQLGADFRAVQRWVKRVRP
jgi:Putative ATPase subunit of terminase (gpP-like)